MRASFERVRPGAALAGAAALAFAGASNLQQISPIIWVITGISAGGAIVTYAFLTYAVLRFQDPATKRRRYG